MLLVIIALLWLALLAPMAIRRLRDGRTERSIESFHNEHEVLSRQGYAVSPVHRLQEADDGAAEVDARASRLTVVHVGDTYRTLESRRSWEEWSEDYDYDRHEVGARPAPVNRYASAYAAVPRDVDLYARDEPGLRRRSMRAQRRRCLTALAAAVLFATSLAEVVRYSMLVDLAIVTWVALAGYVSLGLYAISQGWLDESSVGLGRFRDRRVAVVAPLYDDEDDDTYGGSVAALRDEEFDQPAADGWRRQSARYALG
ncbi:MAG: hypothetical protein ACHQFZ_07805 [Acidimicrobiales bacterium]